LARLGLVALMLAVPPTLPASAQTAPPPDPAVLRDQTSRLATAVLGQVCLLNIGDVAGTLAAAAPGGEFGFIDAPSDVATALLGERPGYVRVLRRAGLGAVSLVITRDGLCSVMAEYADSSSIKRHLVAMVERGGLKGGGQLLPLDSRDAEGMIFTDYAFTPAGWFAKALSKRFGVDGGAPLALVTLVSPPGRAAMEAVLSVRLPRTEP
jgi:hypothetical protein